MAEDAEVERTRRRTPAIDLVIGGLSGFIVAAIVAVNVVIYSGIDEGYEAGLDDILDQNQGIGALVVLLFVTGPIVGMLVARTLRRRNDRHR